MPERNFLSVSISAYIVPQVRVSSFFGRTRNYTNYRNDGGRIYNQGLPIEQIQRVVGRTVTRYQIADLGAEGYRQRGARIQGNQVQIFRPQVQRSVQVAPPVSRPTARRAVVSTEQFRVNHPNRANRRQVQGQGQGQNDRQRTSGGQRQGGQVQPQGDRQRTPETGGIVQRDQYRRPNQVEPQPERQRQVQPRDREPQVQNERQRQVQPQNERQRQPQNDRYQRPPQDQQRQVQPQNDRQRQPQVQPQVNRDDEARAQSKEKDNGKHKGKDKQKDRRDRNQNQDDDEHRPPVQ